MIVDVLKQGYPNRIKGADLQKLTGLTKSGIEKAVHKERENGNLILSTKKGGYFLPANDQEIAHYVKSMSRDAITILKTLKPFRMYLKDNPEQVELKELLAELEKT